MAFHDAHAPSFMPKIFLSASVLAGTLFAVLMTYAYADWLIELPSYEQVEGNIYRQITILACSLIYFIRLTICMFVFIKRKISWFEGGLVSFLFFMMFYLFVSSAGSNTTPIGAIDIVGILLFLGGSYINTLADYQRFAWKRAAENQGRLFTGGLFRYSMHINYFGDSVSYVGLALITGRLVCLLVAFGIIVNFIALQIPMLDRYLGKKYGNDFSEYAKKTKKIFPFVY